MIRFRLLGTVDLRDSQEREVRAVLHRPKLLALLAYFSVARPRGFHRRDTLVALLWPDLDHAHARNALRQAVHALRDALGHEVVAARGEEELGVREEALSCDVRDFDGALKAGQAEEALELYRGELLAGLHVSDGPAFERWLDEEREHVRRRACEAAQLLTDRAEAAGNAMGAAEWALRLTQLSPFDETAVQRLIRLLDRAGDRSGAVRAYEEFERRLARDMELQPSPETQALLVRIRARRAPDTASADSPSQVAIDRESVATPGRRRSGGDERPGRPPAWAMRRRALTVLALAAGGLLTGGWFLLRAQFGAPRAASAASPTRLVVLPFLNVGPAADEYFADGVTEEIAARLATIAGLRVVGGASATIYRNAAKTVQEIGAELGVDYVLEGTVRWQRSAQGPPRVRVTPQLASTADGARLWAQVYDEPLDEIFRVQSDIAQKVVRALDVTLLDRQRRLVDAPATSNLEAYDYYLRGNAQARRGEEERNRRAAIQLYEKAVERDPTFALAYAQLSRMHSQMYGLYYDRSADRLAEAKRAVDRAFALEPRLPEAHLALGAYYFNGYADYDKALREFAIVAARRPSDRHVFLARAILRTRQGNLRDALVDFEKARQLDPASPIVATNHARAYDLGRDFARAEAEYDRAIALAPDRPHAYALKADLYLRWEGQPQKARTVLDEAQKAGVADDPLVLLTAVFIEMADGRYDEALAGLSAGAPEVIETQFRVVPRAQLYAEVYRLMGRPELARAQYDSARSVMSRKTGERPDDPRLRSALGIAYAGLGRKAEAIAEGRKGVELNGRPVDPAYYREWDLARIYAMVGERDAAVARLQNLLSIPGNLTAAWLRIDPAWASLQGHPRFEALLQR